MENSIYLSLIFLSLLINVPSLSLQMSVLDSNPAFIYFINVCFLLCFSLKLFYISNSFLFCHSSSFGIYGLQFIFLKLSIHFFLISAYIQLTLLLIFEYCFNFFPNCLQFQYQKVLIFLTVCY